MKTSIIKLNPCNPDIQKIKKAAEIIKKSGLVAFPTETVYGLGANGLNKDAIKKIFIAKGRPQDNPLILHISDIKQLDLLVKEIPEKAEKLIKNFWPGPLTLVLKKSRIVPKITSAGLNTVAIRMPKNKVALELIRLSKCPLAAPSANLSGKPSPTSAKHVIDDLDNKINTILDAGNTDIGLESTVLDLTQKIPRILRPGKITKKQLEKVVGDIKENKEPDTKKPKSPGMKYKHYAPKAKVIIIGNKRQLEKIIDKNKHKRINILKYKNEIEMAKNLFKDFRESDKKRYNLILVWQTKNKDLGTAIMDRLRKASSEKGF